MSIIDRLPMEVDIEASRVLVVDDEPHLRKALVGYLLSQGLTATGVQNGADAFRAIAAQKLDLILLDVNLGDEDGLQVLRKLRQKSQLPVILMTGCLRDSSDRVLGLELGADDYILKPFDMREMVARVRANLRRRQMDQSGDERPSRRRYGFRGWIFEQRDRILIQPDGVSIHLTRSEFALLSAFVAAPRQPLSRQRLLRAMRMDDSIVDRSIDVLVLRLRRKLESDANFPNLIQTRRGVGYVFDADVAVL